MRPVVSVAFGFTNAFAQNLHFRFDVFGTGVGRTREFQRICAKGVRRQHVAACVKVFSVN